MGFLGSIGIDPVLLIAQIVNFLLLVFILKKYIYKPFIKQLEEDEATLAAAKAEKEKAQTDEKEAEEKSQTDIEDAQKKSAAIITEANELAQKIKRDAEDQARKEKDKLVSDFKIQLEKAVENLEKEKRKEMEQQIAKNVAASLIGQIDEDSVRNLQDSFFRQLLSEVEKLPTQEGQSGGFATIFSAQPTREHQMELLRSELAKKIPGIQVKENEQKELLSGFRLELPNHRIDTNLAFEITHVSHEQ